MRGGGGGHEKSVGECFYMIFWDQVRERDRQREKEEKRPD